MFNIKNRMIIFIVKFINILKICLIALICIEAVYLIYNLSLRITGPSMENTNNADLKEFSPFIGITITLYVVIAYVQKQIENRK